ncbi:MAG: FkbM family methyltransferase [Dinoroseobacter sp.]|nr:FkbM family methyltransferase [Dinoroseobacter sp.]
MPKEEYYIAMMRGRWQDYVKPVKLPVLTERIRITTECGDCEDLPRHPRAGDCAVEDGVAIQYMHNGLKVLYGRYYGSWVNEIIAQLRGVHEPQEERVFAEVLKYIEPGATMVEAGCYWGYYSMWFARQIENARVFLVEPQPNQMKVARRNFEINDLSGDFTHAFFGSYPEKKREIQERRVGELPRLTIGEFMKLKELDHITLLHSDIQGHEEEMLEGASDLLDARKIDWLFISTHGARHPACMRLMQKAGYRVVAEHSVGQSASADGLIVAQNPELPEIPAIEISHVKGLVQAHAVGSESTARGEER